MDDRTNGTPFGRYRLLQLIGRGGMGEVWRAYDTVTERDVALKVLPAEFAGDAVFQERFRREAKSAAALDEPHVVPIYDFGEIDGRLFVTMRLIKGRDLHSLVREGALTPERAVGIIEQIGAALHAAHRVGLVHRDVKPSNILVAEDDFAYLIDFGIARAAGQSGLTGTRSVIGSWAYMAPERLSAGQADARADIYALACVLYECLTGRQPFPGNSLEQQLGGHVALPPPRVSDHRAGAPVELDTVIARGMAKNPAERYATTRELTYAARAAVTGPSTGPLPGPFSGPLAATQLSPFPADPTQYAPYAPMPPGPPASGPYPRFAPPPHPKRSRKGRVVLSVVAAVAVVAVVAVVAAVTLAGSDDTGTGPHGSATAPPAALPNTGPFTGIFSVAAGPKQLWNGSPATGAAAPAYSESWRLRSACAADACIATASTGGHYPVKDLVFDKVGAGWLAVSITRSNCNGRDVEVWNVISVQPQPDGAMSGEATATTANGCFDKRTIAFTRSGDTDIALLPDPDSLKPRAVSPAEALHGSYDAAVTFANGHKNEVQHYRVRTDCLRIGDRCVSLFMEPTGFEPFVYDNGTWTRNDEYEGKCSSGGTMRIKATVTLPLPHPLQDPITLLSGHGYQEVAAGTKCPSQAYDQTFTRTGD